MTTHTHPLVLSELQDAADRAAEHGGPVHINPGLMASVIHALGGAVARDDERGEPFNALFDNARTPAQEAAAERVLDAARMVSMARGNCIGRELLALHHAVQALDAVGALDEDES